MKISSSTDYDAAQPDPRKPGRPTRDTEGATGHIHIRVVMARKNAYVRAAKPKSLAEWATEILDKTSRYGL